MVTEKRGCASLKLGFCEEEGLNSVKSERKSKHHVTVTRVRVTNGDLTAEVGPK